MARKTTRESADAQRAEWRAKSVSCRAEARSRRRLAAVLCLLLAGAAHAEGRVFASPDEVRPLEAGAAVPAVQVHTVSGEGVDLADLVRDSGALLVFYRGGWWPYCNTQLGELRKVEPELASLGFPVVAISPDRASNMTQSLEVKELGYTLLSDSALTAARAFGIAYQLKPEEVEAYRGYGIDLEAAAGRDHHQLPVPSVFLVEKGGTIRWVYSNPDYKVRPENAKLLEAARTLAGSR